jgi:hypothetical protein
MPKQYVFTDSNWVLDPIQEDDAELNGTRNATASTGIVGSGRRRVITRADNLTSDSSDLNALNRGHTPLHLPGIAESLQAEDNMDDDSDEDDIESSSNGLASDSLLGRLRQQYGQQQIQPQQQHPPGLPTGALHPPTTATGAAPLPPRIPSSTPGMGTSSHAIGTKPRLPSTSNSLLNRMMANKGNIDPSSTSSSS